MCFLTNISCSFGSVQVGNSSLLLGCFYIEVKELNLFVFVAK